MRKIGLFTGVLAVAMMMAAPAMACQPSRGTQEEIAAVASAQQTDMWDKADLVFVARIEQSRTKPSASPFGMLEVDLTPLTWLKGQAGPWQFGLADTGWMMCGPLPGFDIIRGQPSEEFVVFATGDTPAQETTLMTVSLKALVEPRARAALKAAQ
jgi:hypothetical protein